MSLGTLGISDAEGLPKRAGVQGCGDPVPEVGDSSGAVEIVLGARGRGWCEERLEKPSLAFGIIKFHKEKDEKNMQGNYSMEDFLR